MIKYILITILALLLSCSGGGGGDSGAPSPDHSPLGCDNPTTDHIKYMGYYWGASIANGNHIDAVSGYTNMMNIHMSENWNSNISLIEEAISKGLAPLVSLEPRTVWLEHDWSRKVHLNMTNWDVFIEKMAPYVKHLAGFYIFDEPYGWGISQSTQEWILSYYRKAFPDSLLWVTFGKAEDARSSIATDYDVISLTPRYNESNAQDYQESISSIKSSMRPGQRIAITMDCYYDDNSISREFEEWKADQAQDYFMIAKCDPQVMALYIFIYPSWMDGVLGVEDMPILESELMHIWEVFE